MLIVYPGDSMTDVPAPASPEPKIFDVMLPILIVVLVAILGVGGWSAWTMYKPRTVTAPTLTTVIPSATSSIPLPSIVPAEPLVFFNGTLEKIEGDTITLRYHDEKTSATASATFLVGKNTQISNSTVSPFFYFRSLSSIKPQQTDKNGLKIKDSLVIAVKKSDSGSSGQPVEAVSVDIINGPFYALVKIIKIEGNVLTVERPGAITNNSSPTLIAINKDTEIVMLKNDSSTKIPTKDDYSQLTTSDLKVDMQIDVYTERNLGTGGENNALQIKVKR